MMWTSYAALCEMGMVTATNADLDPTSIFGVVPSNLTKIPRSRGGYGPEIVISNDNNNGGNNDDNPYHHSNNNNNNSIDVANATTTTAYGQQQQHHHQHNVHHDGKSAVENQEFLKRIREMGGESQSPFHIMNASPIMGASEGIDFHQNHHHHHHQYPNNTSSATRGGGGGAFTGGGQSSFTGGYQNQSSFVPQTPYSRNFTTNVHGDMNNDHHDDTSSAIHATSLFPQTAPSATSSVSGMRGDVGRGHLPSTTLFATPGLTPIPHDQQQQLSFSAFSSTKKDEVFSRAKQVANRLYYEPSPEMTPPSRYDHNNYSDRNKSTLHHHNGMTKTLTPTRPASAVMSSMKTTRRKQFKRRTDLLLAVDESKQGEYSEQRLLFDGMNVDSNHNLDEDMEVTAQDEEIEKMHDGNSVNTSKHIENTLPREKPQKGVVAEGEKNGGDEGIRHILELFCTLGAAQRMLSSFYCKEAISIYRSLPNNQFNTGFVQHQVGRAYFEMADYSNAQRALECMQRVESYR